MSKQKKSLKRKRFERWAASRVNKAILALKRVRGMGNKSIWEYTDDEASRIIERLRVEVDRVEGALTQRVFNFKL